MTQAKFPMMLDEERAKYVTREIKYEQEIESLRQQLTDALNEGIRLQLVADDVRNAYSKALRDTEKELRQQLSAATDLDDLILCHAEPIGWRLENDGVEYGITSYNREQADEYVAAGWNLKETIYRAWKPKG